MFVPPENACTAAEYDAKILVPTRRPAAELIGEARRAGPELCMVGIDPVGLQVLEFGQAAEVAERSIRVSLRAANLRSIFCQQLLASDAVARSCDHCFPIR